MSSVEKGMAIGEVARRAGINASAIRYYEKAGLLAEPERVNGRRRYGPEVLDLLAVIRVAQRAGFTISETRTLMNGCSAEDPPSERWRVLAREKLSEIEAPRPSPDLRTRGWDGHLRPVAFRRGADGTDRADPFR